MPHTPDPEQLLHPAQDLPADHVMIETALDILNHSPHGQQLVDMVQRENIEIKIIATPQPTTYLPESKKAYIGFNRNTPISPVRFIVMLAGLLREAQQELAGIPLPGLSATRDEHVKTAMAKFEDTFWYKCKIAHELDSLSVFSEYKFLDELRKMGHTDVVELFLKQEGLTEGDNDTQGNSRV